MKFASPPHRRVLVINMCVCALLHCPPLQCALGLINFLLKKNERGVCAFAAKKVSFFALHTFVNVDIDVQAFVMTRIQKT